MLTERKDSGLNTKGQIGDKSCIMTIDTGVFMMISRPNITEATPKKELPQLFDLQMPSGQTFSLMKDMLIELTLGLCQLRTWKFIADH
jgi:hypothetical protein